MRYIRRPKTSRIRPSVRLRIGNLGHTPRRTRENGFRRFGKTSTFGKILSRIRRNAHPDTAECPPKLGKMLTNIPRKALLPKGFRPPLRISGSKRSSIRRSSRTEESKKNKDKMHRKETPKTERRMGKHGEKKDRTNVEMEKRAEAQRRIREKSRTVIDCHYTEDTHRIRQWMPFGQRLTVTSCH